MSVKVMSLVWDVYPGSGSELLAMLALADWCNDAGGSLYPSMRAVAEKIRVSEKQARRIVQTIVERGFLGVVGNEYGGKPGSTKQFQIDVFRLRELVTQAKNEDTPPASVTPLANVTPPTNGSRTPPTSGSRTPPMQGRDPSHGCPFTPPTGGSLTTIEPSCEPPTHTAGVREAASGSKPKGSVCVHKNQKQPKQPPEHGHPLAVQASEAMRGAGIADVYPEHPSLLALLTQGIGIQAIAEAAAIAVRNQHTDLAYAIGVVKRQILAAKAMASGPIVANESWDTNRRTIESEGVQLGLGKWDADDISPERELFKTYTERVRVARMERYEAAAC